MNMMLDLKNMTDEEFSILVTPSAPQAAMYVKIEETGSVLLSSKVAEKWQRCPSRFDSTRIVLRSRFAQQEVGTA